MKRALCVGLNDYPGTNKLSGCVNDAQTVASLLERHEDKSKNFDCKLLTSAAQVTRVNLMGELTALFAHQADVACFYFSGHGLLDENLGGFLVTSDFSSPDYGIRMNELISLANNSSVSQAVIILDCCHSGEIGTIKGQQSSAGLREGISILTASRGNQVSLEGEGFGLFTKQIIAALEGGAADILGKVSVTSIYAYVHEIFSAWDQRPLFKANVSRQETLRNCVPQVSLEIMHSLTTWFPGRNSEFSLDPSFEPESEPIDEVNQAVFSKLQKLRSARMLEPVGEEHLYHAAMRSKSCRLTKLGQYYWDLVKDGRI